MLLYADDIMLISDSSEELQRHLNDLKLFCMDNGLSISMDKTEVMVFNTLTKGKDSIHRLLHIPRSNVHMLQFSL